MPEPSIRLEFTTVAGVEVGRITVDNPRKLNSLGSALLGHLKEAAEAASREPSVRAVVLTGSGEQAFIGGADVNELNSLTPATAAAFITRVHQSCQALRDLQVPVIAAIRGYCLGAGLEIAAACDIRIASSDAVLGMPEVRMGLPSVVEAALLPRLIGWGRTSHLLLTGATIGAEEAERWGLVERVVSPEELMQEVEDVLGAIAASGVEAVKAQKALMRRWEALPLAQAIEAGVDAFAAAYRTSEPIDMTGAFINRRRG
jgi:enoyl-CoA hydratase/carnithine racemase